MRLSVFLLLCQSVLLCTGILDIPMVLLTSKRSSLIDCPVRYYTHFETEVKTPVVYGEPASLREFSHMAAIGWTRKDESGVDWKCGGSLITLNAVLTAAHCLSSAGVAPDIVRLGDINIYSPDDDQFAQQFKIESIIRHPKYRSSAYYDDIALLLLDGDIVLHDTVAPACLWGDDSIEFKELEATGWGRTHSAQRSEKLMKVKLRPFKNSECNNYYDPTFRMKDGIRPTQLCAGDFKSDTCWGDSGGPLEVKLLGAGHLTPFLVGITSFGRGCGSLVPGVYTRVSSYIDWIQQALNHTVLTDPIECTLRYKRYREYEPNVISKRISNFIEIDESLRHIKDDNFFTKHVVEIGWSGINKLDDDADELDLSAKSVAANWECGGVLINEDYVLTSAQCLQKRDRLPDLIKTQDLQFIKISKITNHPDFNPTFYYHDLALVQLANDVNVSTDGARPACLWPNPEPGFNTKKLQMSSFGPTNINIFAENYLNTGLDDVKTPVHLKVTIPLTENTDCNVEYQKTGNLVYGVNSQYQICMKNPVPIVPGACEISRGGGVQQQLRFYGRVVNYVFAINSFGDNCGFRTPIVATKIQPYLGWINEVIFGPATNHNKLAFSSYVDWVKQMFMSNSTKPQKPVTINDDVVFFDNMNVGDVCHHGSTKIRGQCVEESKCNGGHMQTAQNEHLEICAVSPEVLVCCPDDLVGKTTQKNSTTGLGSLTGCAYKYSHLRMKKYPNLALEINHRPTEDNELAHIGELYVVENPADSCYTTLISDQHVITSAKCAKNFQEKELWLGWDDESQYFKITEVFVHPKYNEAENVNDLVVMKLNSTVSFSPKVQPACIWYDNELIPYELQQQILDNTYFIYVQHYAYNADCQKLYDRFNPANQIQLNDTILCVQENVCPKLGVTIQKMISIDNKQVPYVFGVYFQKRNCASTDARLPFLYTRLAPYVDWIQGVIDQ